MKWLGIKDKFSRKEILEILNFNKSIYTISPSLFTRPEDWHPNLKVLGFHQSSNTNEWQADKDLNDFIEKHDKILFITFGSMTNSAPEEKTTMILDILESNKIPAIINTASRGLVKSEKYDSNLIHFVSRIPYDWILPKIYGVIHHGGSGTTHLGLKYGCATMVIPHIIDQLPLRDIAPRSPFRGRRPRSRESRAEAPPARKPPRRRAAGGRAAFSSLIRPSKAFRSRG